MLSLLKRRIVVAAAGLALLATVVWHAGPLVYPPIEPYRILLIALLVAVWLGWALIKRVRAARASSRLAAALVEQSRRDERPSPEVLRLREQFEEAVATLKESSRRGGQGLYDLPWYVFIGAPGSGKTTALVNAGLRFPLESRAGRAALRGIGGTRNCDWWFTDEAVFLDTAGRYTTQDSDPDADVAAWREFLSLLRTHRGRRPINGIILTVSASDLLAQGADEREAYMDAARRRLQELNRELRIQVPVYVMVTKCDLVAGFREYFDDLGREARAQVWGTTFTYEQTVSGEAARQLPAEFDRLMRRLNERVLGRLAEERDLRRRARVFAFPRQMAGLRDALVEFTTEVFTATRFEQPILLRGVYLTSGTQEGTPIDRLLGALGRQFAMGADAVAPPPGRGKAYFIERLLREVVFAESGLAGVNRRVEWRNAALQLGAYAALALAAVAAVVLLTVSYGRNRNYIADVHAEVQRLQEVQQAEAAGAPPFEQVRARLDTLRAVVGVAERHRDHRPLTMRWGLYQGTALGDLARDLYVRELNNVLLPPLGEHVQRQLDAVLRPEDLYEHLKAYLMLGGRAPAVDVAFLRRRMTGDGMRADDPLAPHLATLFENDARIRPLHIDDARVARARRAIESVSLPQLAYRYVKGAYVDHRSLDLDVETDGGARVLRRRSGASLSEPQPGLYTRAVFDDVTRSGALKDLMQEYARERWVWGDANAPSMDASILEAEVLRLYEDDYIRHWEALVNDVSPVRWRSDDEVRRGLEIMSRPLISPLRLFYETVRTHTLLVSPPESTETPAPGRFGGSLGGILDFGGVRAAGDPPGTRITRHFAAVHQLVEAAGTAPIDRALGDIRQIQQTLEKRNGPGESPSDPKWTIEVRGQVRALNEGAARLLPAFGAFVREVGDVAESNVAGGTRSHILQRYGQMVDECTFLTGNGSKYPFAPHGTADMPLEDFARLFGPAGVFESFFASELRDHVDTAARPWRWRAGGGLNLSPEIPPQFQRAREIREVFFRTGAQAPQLTFTLTPDGLHDQVLRFRIDAGEAMVLEYLHGAVRSATVTWPGAGPVVATFEGAAGIPAFLEYRGEWAWLRMLEGGELTRESAVRYDLRLRTQDVHASLHVDLPSSVNVLDRRDRLREFRCDASR